MIKLRLVQLASGAYAVQRSQGKFGSWDFCEINSRDGEDTCYGDIWHGTAQIIKYCTLLSQEAAEIAFEKTVKFFNKKYGLKVVKVIKQVKI